jgi:hypothetical protein
MSRHSFTSAFCAAVFALAMGSAARADDAKCQDEVAKGSRKIGNAEQKKNRACVKDGSGDISTCVSTEAAKAAAAEAKLAKAFAPGGKCDPVPMLGVNAGTAAAIAAGTADSAGDILRGVFGDPVDGIAAGDDCLDKIAKRGGKVFDKRLKVFRACIKDNAPLPSQGHVDVCVQSGIQNFPTAEYAGKLLADMQAACETFPPAGMDDGDCSACTDALSCSNCIIAIINCEACEAMNNSSNGTADCDALDDGMANASCG